MKTAAIFFLTLTLVALDQATDYTFSNFVGQSGTNDGTGRTPWFSHLEGSAVGKSGNLIAVLAYL